MLKNCAARHATGRCTCTIECDGARSLRNAGALGATFRVVLVSQYSRRRAAWMEWVHAGRRGHLFVCGAGRAASACGSREHRMWREAGAALRGPREMLGAASHRRAPGPAAWTNIAAALLERAAWTALQHRATTTAPQSGADAPRALIWKS